MRYISHKKGEKIINAFLSKKCALNKNVTIKKTTIILNMHANLQIEKDFLINASGLREA